MQTVCVEVRKDKEMELEILSADISNWEGEVSRVPQYGSNGMEHISVFPTLSVLLLKT